MNKEERKIIGLLRRFLSLSYIVNPCDIKGLAGFHNNAKSRISEVKGYLEEIQCFDIPKERLKEIIKELEKEVKPIK